MGIQKRPAQMKVKGVADIVFCFDCTGSMTEIITSVKENVEKLINGFKEIRLYSTGEPDALAIVILSLTRNILSTTALSFRQRKS